MVSACITLNPQGSLSKTLIRFDRSYRVIEFRCNPNIMWLTIYGCDRFDQPRLNYYKIKSKFELTIIILIHLQVSSYHPSEELCQGLIINPRQAIVSYIPDRLAWAQQVRLGVWGWGGGRGVGAGGPCRWSVHRKGGTHRRLRARGAGKRYAPPSIFRRKIFLDRWNEMAVESKQHAPIFEIEVW